MQRGRIPSKERKKAISRIIQALKNNPDGLGVRELFDESRIGSLETFYKYLRELESENKIAYHEVNVGRGKPKKVYKLTQKGIAHLYEFRVIEYFDKIRESCKNELFQLNNYTFSYLIYGIPKKLEKDEKSKVASILKKINSGLIELENLKYQIVNKEAYSYREILSNIKNRIIKDVLKENQIYGIIEFDSELENEIMTYIPSKIRDKMRLSNQEHFAILATRGPSFIDEYGLRPENYLVELLESVKTWDEKEVNFVLKQLARNKFVDQEAINMIKKSDIFSGIIKNKWWQKIKGKLDEIPKIRAEMNKEKEQLIQSGNFKKSLGIKDNSIIITKDMIGKEKLDEIKKELSQLV